MSEYRRLVLDPRWIHTVRPEVLPWDGKIVTVRSWHSLMNDHMKQMFPNDEMVGFVEEFMLDIPQSELK